MKTLETEVEIGADGSLTLLAPLPAWMKPGRAHILLTLTPDDSLPESGGIEKTPGVNGGDACIASTRIPVWVLEEIRLQGTTDEEILKDFPGLTPARLAQAWAYVKHHAVEIDAARNSHAGA